MNGILTVQTVLAGGNKHPVWPGVIRESQLKELLLNTALKNEWDLWKQERRQNSSLGRMIRMENWISSWKMNRLALMDHSILVRGTY